MPTVIDTTDFDLSDGWVAGDDYGNFTTALNTAVIPLSFHAGDSHVEIHEDHFVVNGHRVEVNSPEEGREVIDGLKDLMAGHYSPARKLPGVRGAIAAAGVEVKAEESNLWYIDNRRVDITEDSLGDITFRIEGQAPSIQLTRSSDIFEVANVLMARVRGTRIGGGAMTVWDLVSEEDET